MTSEGIAQPPPQGTKTKQILIVDDDRDIGEMLEKVILEQTSYEVMWIAEGDLVLEVAPYVHPSLIILDYMLSTMRGLELYDRLQSIDHLRHLPVILISGWATLPFEQLRERGIYFLKKPFELSDLLDLLAELLPD